MRMISGSFLRKALTLASYGAAGGVIAFWTAYWPASAGNILTKLNIASQLAPMSDVASDVASEVTSQVDKTDRLPGISTDRLPGISFEERWNSMPVTPAARTRDRKTEHESPPAGERAEKVPFSCEMAFSRLVTQGNFSTRCIASAATTTKLAAAE